MTIAAARSPITSRLADFRADQTSASAPVLFYSYSAVGLVAGLNLTRRPIFRLKTLFENTRQPGLHIGES